MALARKRDREEAYDKNISQDEKDKNARSIGALLSLLRTEDDELSILIVQGLSVA